MTGCMCQHRRHRRHHVVEDVARLYTVAVSDPHDRVLVYLQSLPFCTAQHLVVVVVAGCHCTAMAVSGNHHLAALVEVFDLHYMEGHYAALIDQACNCRSAVVVAHKRYLVVDFRLVFYHQDAYMDWAGR